MPTDTTLLAVTREQWPVIERLWQLYRHDLSEFRGSMPDGEGVFKAERLHAHLADPDGRGYLIHAATALAGFVLVSGVTREPRTIFEFFVVRAARRRGIGHQAAVAALGRHPGRWEIAFQEENPAAAAFWRRVVAEVAGSSYEQQRRPVPGKPHLPPDTWLLLNA